MPLLLKRKWQTWLYLYMCLHMYLFLSLYLYMCLHMYLFLSLSLSLPLPLFLSLLGKAAAAFFLVSSFFQIRPDQAFGRRNDDAPSGGR